MELYEAMRTTFACREFTGEAVPGEVLQRIIDNARFAPSGGNRQGWRIINVVDPGKKDQLADLSLTAATRYVLESQSGESPINSIRPSSVTDEQVLATEPPQWFVAYIRNAPTLLVITVDLTRVTSGSSGTNRVTYPHYRPILFPQHRSGTSNTE